MTPSPLPADVTQAVDVINSLPLGLITVDSHGLVVFANAAASGLLGWASADLVGKDLHDTAHHHRPDGSAYPRASCPVVTTLADRYTRTVDRDTLWRSNGAPIVCDLTASPLAAGGMTVTIRDAFARLELARAQDEFVAVVSHELRTPLASLLGALKMVNIEGIDETQRELLIGIAHRNAERLARLVDDILDLEKVRTGAISLARAELTDGALCASVADAVAGTALARNVSIEVEDAGVTFWADPMRIEQVLTNLLDNAIKHSPDGGSVTLRVHRRRTEVAIDVIDHGVGISPQDLQHVFERFWQADSSARRVRSGSGLGLTISRAIMELHGGSLSVASAVGTGTTFTVHLPVRAIDLAVPVNHRVSDEEAGHAPHSSH